MGWVMRRFVQVVLVVLVFAMVGGTARAGTEKFPEMSDECAGFVHAVAGSTRVRHPSLDLCKGWFTAAAGPSGAPVLEVTLQANSGPAEGVGGLYMARWRSGDCTYAVTVDNAVNSPHPQAFSAGCGARPPVECGQLALQCDDDSWHTYPLPAGSVRWEGNQLQVTVSFDGALASFAGDHADGAVLSEPFAFSSATVGPAYGYAFACSNHLGSDRCVEANGDWMYGVRDYTVGT